MADQTTERDAEASPGLTTAVMQASLSSKMFDAPAPAVSIDRFRVLRVVGQGAVGAVYEAYDPRLDRRLALKLVRGGLPEAAQALLLDEARTLAKVAHPNVVTVFDAGTVEDRVYIAMEFVDEGSLRDWLLEPRSTPEIVDAFVQAGQGLAAAHRLGVVHRDFKPANVLRTGEGLVKVGDFGLARARESERVETTGDALAHSSSSSGGLVTSTVAGTPAYMAPEALEGTIDPRSDQYSFCVALWEALFGERPAAGGQAIARGGAPPTRGGGRKVSRRVVAAIERGLSVDPGQRWPSMEALLAALRPPAAKRAWRGAAIVGVGAVLAAAFAFEPTDAPCSFEDDGLAGAWDESTRGRGRAAFEALALPYAEDTWVRVASVLDDRAAAWTQTRRDACEASLVRHERSAEAYDLVGACLERHRDATAELTAVLVEPDAAIAERAVAAASSLPSLEECRRIEWLRKGGPLADPVANEAVEKARRGLARAEALLEFGRVDEAHGALEPPREVAEDLAEPRLLAEVRRLEGRVAQARGEFDAAVQAYEAALELAARGQHDRLAAKVWVDLVDIYAKPLSRPGQALTLSIAARVAVARLDGDAALEAIFEHALGSAYQGEDDLAKAEAHHRKALELRRASAPDDTLGLAESLGRLGDVLIAQRRSAESVELLSEVRDQLTSALSADHPRVATAEARLARALAYAGRFEESVERFERSIAISRASLGPGHHKTLTRVVMLGTMLGQTGQAAEGIALLEGVVPIYETRPNDPTYPALLNNLGGLYDAVDRPEDSLSVHLRLRGVLIEQGKRDTSAFALNSSNLGLMQSDLGRYADAESSFRESIETYEATLGPEHQDLWRPNAMFATMLRKTGRAQEGLPYAERAVELLEGSTSDPNEVATAQFELARTRWDAGRRDGQTLALARRARVRWNAAELAEHAADVDAWLAGKE
ncbi:MAG: protein kinase domain-containing protein [Nannocystaceae bacterium]|nr:tetratricopeptide repeat protein [bacterium]